MHCPSPRGSAVLALAGAVPKTGPGKNEAEAHGPGPANRTRLRSVLTSDPRQEKPVWLRAPTVSRKKPRSGPQSDEAREGSALWLPRREPAPRTRSGSTPTKPGTQEPFLALPQRARHPRTLSGSAPSGAIGEKPRPVPLPAWSGNKEPACLRQLLLLAGVLLPRRGPEREEHRAAPHG
jgi:hypothetical protein